uniref:Ig-like domain-containing protein n=1 Tax=Ascaris lumbricoides TaxID=6252 RepID=A0A0M3HZ81_ASCLU
MFLNLFLLFAKDLSTLLSWSLINYRLLNSTLKLITVLVYIAVDYGNAATQPTVVTVVNGSSVTMKCEPAEHLVRTHMAPDFESPQLIRKLDWFHEDALIASYQQVRYAFFSIIL